MFRIVQSVVPRSIRLRLLPAWPPTPRRLARCLRWRMASPEARAQMADRSLPLDRYYWLFVLGVNNSGTTLLVRILESHPLVRTLPREGQHLTYALPRPSDFGVERLWTKRPDIFRWTEESAGAPALRARWDWAAFYDRRPGVLLEKSPPNALRGRWLQRHFKPSRFIAIARDPYAVCEGIRRREGHTLEEAAAHWAAANACILDDMERLEQRLLVRYEDLCSEPEATLAKIEAFLGLEVPFDRAIITQSIDIRGTNEKIRSFNAESLKRLSPQEIAMITRVTGPVMARLGYEPAAGG